MTSNVTAISKHVLLLQDLGFPAGVIREVTRAMLSDLRVPAHFRGCEATVAGISQNAPGTDIEVEAEGDVR